MLILEIPKQSKREAPANQVVSFLTKRDSSFLLELSTELSAELLKYELHLGVIEFEPLIMIFISIDGCQESVLPFKTKDVILANEARQVQHVFLRECTFDLGCNVLFE